MKKKNSGRRDSRERSESRPIYSCEFLDGLVRLWEESCRWHLRVEEAAIANHFGGGGFICPNWIGDSGFQNFQTFREYLLSIHQNDPKLATIEKFDWPKPLSEFGKAQFDRTLGVHSVPREVAQWNRNSRRVYHITPELQAILSATDVESVNWTDVKLPFESYGIRLASPIRITPKIQASFLLLSRDKENNVRLRCLASPIVAFKANENLEIRYKYLLKSRNFHALAAMVSEQVVKTMDVAWGVFLHVGDLALRNSVLKPCATESGHEHIKAFGETLTAEEGVSVTQGVGAAIRVCVGLALYLQTLPSSDSHVSSWKGELAESGPDDSVLRQAGQICSVSHNYEIDHELRVALGLEESSAEDRGRLGANWQFVAGYWRRPSGLGRIFGAAKTQHVRPYMRRRDRMPEDSGLPGGAEQRFV